MFVDCNDSLAIGGTFWDQIVYVRVEAVCEIVYAMLKGSWTDYLDAMTLVQIATAMMQESQA